MDSLGTIGYRTELDPSGAKRGAELLKAEIRTLTAEIDKMDAEVEIRADISDFERDIIEAQAEVKELTAKKRDVEIGADTSELDRKLATARARVDSLTTEKKKVRLDLSNLKELERRLTDDERAYTKLTTAASRQELAWRKEGVAVEKLTTKYSAMANERNKIMKQKFWQTTDVDRQRLRLLGTEMDFTRSKLHAMGRDTRDLDDDIDNHDGTLKRWASSLANVRVHVGVASLTIKQMGIALAVIGPVIEGVIGMLSALVGVGLEAVAGGGLVAAAGLTALGVSAFGLISAIKPAAAEMGKATAAAKAYNDAVVKYGENSDQAKTAQENLNNTMKNISPAARGAVEQYQKMNAAWQKLTEPTRAEFFKTVESGLRGANRMLPAFAKATNEVAHSLGSSLRDAVQNITTDPQFKNAFSNLMHNWSSSIPGFISGLTNLAKAAMNVFSSVSRHFSDISGSFNTWSAGLLKSTRDTQSLNKWVDGLMDSLSSVGRFLKASGRTIWTFFTAGAEEGRGLLDGWTNSLNELSDSMETASGQKALGDWFAEAVQTGKQFMEVIGSFGEVLLHISDAFRPLMQGTLEFLDGIGSALRALPQPLLDVLAKVIAVGIAFKVFAGIRTLIMGAVTAMGLLATETAIVEGGAAGGLLARVFGGGRAAAQGTLFGASVGTATTRLGALGVALRSVAGGPIGLFIGGTLAVKMGLDAAGVETDTLEHKFGGLGQVFEDTGGKAIPAGERISRALENTSGRSVTEGIQAMRSYGIGIGKLQQLASGEFVKVGDGWMELTDTTQEAVHRMLEASAGLGSQTRALLGKRALRGVMNWSDIQGSFAGATNKMLVDIGQMSTRLGRLGKQKEVVHILADSDTAAEAVRRLNALLDETKKERKAKITADARQAEATTQHVIRRFGDIPTGHRTKIDVTDNASGPATSIRAAIDAIHSKTVTIAVNTIASYVKRGVSGGGAEGGALTTTGPSRVEQFAGGGQVTKPIFVIGEEAPKHPEFVIATNPAYRQQNVNYLMQAAAALGIMGYKKGKAAGAGYRRGSIPEEQAQAEYDAAKTRKESAKRKLHDKEKQTKPKASGKEIAAARKRAKAAQDDFKQAKANLKALKAVNVQIAILEAQIGLDESNMQRFALEGDTAKFAQAQAQKVDDINKLINKLQKAAPGAKGVFKLELQTRIADLFTDLGQSQLTPGGAMTVAQAQQLAQIESNVAVAATTATGADDAAAQQALINFWENRLAGLQAAHATPGAIQEAAEALTSARGGSGGGAGGGGIVSQGDLFLGARQDLYKSFGGNALWNDAALTSPGPGFGMGGGNGVTIQQTFNEPPPDPHTWSAQMAHEVAAGGMGT